ncbi:MAG: rhomboid family intramembrane serine protease [Planctomycetales bacterium]|nr:rhomboid family intramembrane serine protease [Planctomycetales bacterium]
MGIYDREYYRDERPQGMQLRAPQTMVVTLILINVAFWVADLIFFQGRLMVAMGATAQSLYPLHWWQLLSAGFAHDPTDIFHLLLNMFMLWMFGRHVEARLGKWEFLRFYLAAVIVGNLVFAAHYTLLPAVNEAGQPIQHLCFGASGAVTAVTILFAVYFRDVTVYFMMLFPMPAWVFGVILIVMNLLKVGGPGIAYDVHLGGAAFGLLYCALHWNFGRLIPAALAERLGFRADALRRTLRGGPKLRVHSPDGPAPEERYRAMDEEADRILAKIIEQGEESLSPAERRTLEDYSRRMRQKHR